MGWAGVQWRFLDLTVFEAHQEIFTFMHLCLLFFLPICLLTFANLSYFMETETNGKKCKIDKHFLKMFCKVPKDYNSTATGVLVCLNGKSFQWPLLPTLNPALCGQMCFIFSGFTDTDSARHSAQQNIRPLSRAHFIPATKPSIFSSLRLSYKL